MATVLTDRRQYIENCIKRIIDAPCAPKNSGARAKDLAEAVVTAAGYGAIDAHEYLIQLCNEAEAGKYK